MLHFLLFSSFLLSSLQHTETGTEYGERGADVYTHGPDGALFLDPYFKPDLKKLTHKKLLDAGCGTGYWAIYAAKHGADVYAIDIQESMIRTAKSNVESAGVGDQVFLTRGDVSDLPYRDNFFDKAISICVACNLPLEVFKRHFSELSRTLKKDGVLVVAAPTSLDVIFTDGTKENKAVSQHIQETLTQLQDDPSAELITEKLMTLSEVLSATFYMKNHKLTLVTNESDLKDGDPIWRKLPELIVPNRFYTRESYIQQLKKYFTIEKMQLPHFKTEKARQAYNSGSKESQLGPAYVTHPPFVIFHVKKK